MRDILEAIKTVLSDKKYLAVAIFSAVALIAVYIVSLSSIVLKSFGIITDTIILNSILSGSLPQLILIVILSMFFGLWLAMQIYVRREKKVKIEKTSVATSGGGIFGGFFSGLGALGACPGCLAILTGIIGVNAVVFLLKYRTPIVLSAITLTFLSIYTTSKSINSSEGCFECGHCKKCRAENK